jgi:pimeloyl-ACP methyl ester carboxylesterase
LELALFDYHVFDADESGLTLVFTHGTSFNKDLWHLIIDFLITSQELQGLIRRVVAIDAVNHGDSALLNEDKIGTAAFWPDNAYDILTTIQTLGLSQPLVGIGHSFGGGIMYVTDHKPF